MHKQKGMFLTNILRFALARSVRPFVFENRDLARQNLYDLANLGLYVHIPFCETLCPFCPYNKEKYDKELMKKFIPALKKEIALRAGGNEKKKVDSLYFGGGTPSLAVDYLPEIIAALEEHFVIDKNRGIELHPDNITPGLLKKLKAMNFDIISIGVQSFQEKTLVSLGRKISDADKKLQAAAAAGFRAIDVDIIFGIPGQTAQDLADDLGKAVELGATQISTYPFIDFTYAENIHPPLKQREKKKLLKAVLKTVTELGFERTSVWTFGKKGSPHYSSVTRDNFMGFGPSATSLLRSEFLINTFNIDEYIRKLREENHSPTALIMDFNHRTRSLYWLFWSCYNMNISADQHQLLFGRRLERTFGAELLMARLLGIVKKTEGGYMLTEKGAFWYHRVEQKYTNQYIDKTWNIAGKKAWPEKITLY